MNRIVVLIVLAGFVVSACGDEGLLDGIGRRTQRAVVGTTTSTSVPDLPDGVGDPDETVAAAALRWYNDDIADQAVGLPAYTIGKVWERGHDEGRFIQSSRAEIAVALPGIQFPSEVPSEVSSITSQLVYLEDVATLDAGTSAAFGLWEVEPYSSEEGRVGVLRVGDDREDVPAGEVLEEVVTSGLSLIWTDGRYRYELFCRASLPEEQCHHMANLAAPLRELLES